MNNIEDYRNLGLGLFIHFGLYSIIGKGEWVKYMHNIDDCKYGKLFPKRLGS